MQSAYLRQNAAIVAQVSLPIDAEIKSADEAVHIQTVAMSALSKQVAALRQTEAYRFRVGRKGKIDPEFDNGVRSFESRVVRRERKARQSQAAGCPACAGQERHHP